MTFVFRLSVLLLMAFLCGGRTTSRVVAQDAPALVVSEDFLSSLPAGQQLLIKDFADKRRKLRHVYRNMSLDASVTSQRAKPPGTELKPTKEHSGSLATLDGKWFRLDGVYSRTPGVAILGPEEGFIFGRGDRPDAWFLVNRFPANSDLVDRYISSYRFDRHPLDCGDFYTVVYGTQQQGEVIELQSMVESGEGRSKTVTANLLTQLTLSDGQFYHTLTRVVLLPNLSWATKELFRASAQTKKGYYVILQRLMEYEGESDGVPLLKTSVEESAVSMFEGSSEFCATNYSAGPLLVARRDTAVITNFDPTPPLLSEFDHRTYLKAAGGLGDVLNPSRTAIIFVLNGIVLFVLGLWLFLKRPRRRTASGENTGQAE